MASLLPQRILIVDDEPFVLELMHEVLTLHGYDVLTAATLAEARGKILSEPLNLIISDVSLPDSERTALPTLFGGEPSCPGIPVIFMTGYQPPPLAGVQHPVLIKPFAVDTLLRTVQQEISGHPSQV